jgi:hypothetical protein
MRFLGALSVLIGWAGAAVAACLPQEQTFMTCTIASNGKALSVCFDPDRVHYRFGPQDQPPELALSVSMADIAYTPWPGVGRAIWESVAFPNNGYVYQVFAGFDRMIQPDDPENPAFGGVHVLRDDQIIAELRCAPDALDFTWGEDLFQAKQAAGLTYDMTTQSWVAAAAE